MAASAMMFKQPTMLMPLQTMSFTGKTESGHKFRTPKLRMRVVRPISPPPRENLVIPKDMDVETFCKQIGGDCDDIADKFESMDEVFSFDTVS